MTSTRELPEIRTEDSLVVSEVFGPTYQGEGPLIGRVATFIRLGGCNLSCSWCDSPYTWDATRYDLRAELGRVKVANLLQKVATDGSPNVVITGGEPLLHQGQAGWGALLDGLQSAGREIQVETNGTVLPATSTIEAVRHFNVSPKLANSGEPLARRIKPEVLAELAGTGSAIFKFVCRDDSDLSEVESVADAAALPRDLIWIMPEGTEAGVLTQRSRSLASECLARRYNFTPRLHVLLWKNERGR